MALSFWKKPEPKKSLLDNPVGMGIAGALGALVGAAIVGFWPTKPAPQTEAQPEAEPWAQPEAKAA